jgi:hypothetical protein
MYIPWLEVLRTLHLQCLRAHSGYRLDKNTLWGQAVRHRGCLEHTRSVCMYVFMYVCGYPGICVYVLAYACVYVCTRKLLCRARLCVTGGVVSTMSWHMYMCGHVCMVLCVYVCVYMCVCIYIYIYIYIYIHMKNLGLISIKLNTHTHTHIHACLYPNKFQVTHVPIDMFMSPTYTHIHTHTHCSNGHAHHLRHTYIHARMHMCKSPTSYWSHPSS